MKKINYLVDFSGRKLLFYLVICLGGILILNFFIVVFILVYYSREVVFREVVCKVFIKFWLW